MDVPCCRDRTCKAFQMSSFRYSCVRFMMYSIHHSVGPAKYSLKIMGAGGVKSGSEAETLVLVCGECGTDFLENCPRSRFWIERCSDRPADHEVVRPGSNRLRRSRDPRLIVGFPLSLASGASCNLGSHAGDNDQKTLAAGAANGTHLLRGRHNPIEACSLGEA